MLVCNAVVLRGRLALQLIVSVGQAFQGLVDGKRSAGTFLGRDIRPQGAPTGASSYSGRLLTASAVCAGCKVPSGGAARKCRCLHCIVKDCDRTSLVAHSAEKSKSGNGQIRLAVEGIDALGPCESAPGVVCHQSLGEEGRRMCI